MMFEVIIGLIGIISTVSFIYMNEKLEVISVLALAIGVANVFLFIDILKSEI